MLGGKGEESGRYAGWFIHKECTGLSQLANLDFESDIIGTNGGRTCRYKNEANTRGLGLVRFLLASIEEGFLARC